MTWEVRTGDCVDLMAAMEPGSVDAVVCDPPYGLEFMGKEWDRFRVDDPGTNRHRGERAGLQGDRSASGGIIAADGRPSYGGGKRPHTHRCVGCGKRDQFRNPHEPCGEGVWRAELIDPHAAPPTMLAFQEWCRIWAIEALRVLKPGGHLLAFGGTRTSHRLVCAIEDAGFEIRDTICWMYGSGFPKSLDVSKAIDNANGAERETVGLTTHPDGRPRSLVERDTGVHEGGQRLNGVGLPVTAPATPDAERWDGWGTALKPAHEPIVVARKPLSGTVAQTVLEHGTGALNVDGCRVEHANSDDLAISQAKNPGRGDLVTSGVYGSGRPQQSVNDSGRWPANVVLDEEAARLLDEQSGQLSSGNLNAGHKRGQGLHIHEHGYVGGGTIQRDYGGDSGGASRFFYTAKASRAERNAGLDGFEEQVVHDGRHTPISNPYLRAETQRRNTHPTVKPVALMRWLVRLVTPPGGLVLDPFVGSGTTGIAAVLEGFDFLGLERDADYADIARARIAWWAKHGHDALRIVAEQEAAENEREAVRASGQLELL